MKKTLSIVLCTLLFAVSVIPAFAYTGENYILFSGTSKVDIPENQHIEGDSNGDGVVDLKDALAVFKYITGNKSNTLRDSIDVNSDNTVSIMDALLVIKHLLGSEVGLGELVG